ncbi:hypothetical protein [Rhodococcus rhodochrous]|uniref:hypothetical protein n=1 Tax=Rhodococcus rhodochrous TaxID=1829 RepID=UPI001783719F|nr:hypothetical protein [Rhodococcus rhodochrous]QOH56209.1 hypothetical protein C6Y44_09735 [Rhodococcus rhodochrous]
MSEHFPATQPEMTPLEQAVAEKFAGMSNAQIIRRMERSADFSTDDEEYELTRRTRLGGLAWKYSGDLYRPKVEIYKPEGGEDE